MALFKDRSEAGGYLARRLDRYSDTRQLVVLALPRGGVPVGFEIASALGAPLDVLLVRKLGAPGQPELAMGAIASGGIQILNEDVISALHVDKQTIDAVSARESQELARREQAYRGGRPGLEVRNHTVILVDDGVATGATMRAAIAALKQRKPERIVVAVPTAAQHTYDELRDEVDDFVCLSIPYPYFSVGSWYGDFSQTRDEEVRALLSDADRQSKVVSGE